VTEFWSSQLRIKVRKQCAVELIRWVVSFHVSSNAEFRKIGVTRILVCPSAPNFSFKDGFYRPWRRPMSIPSYDALACDPLDPPQRLKLGRLLVGRRKSQKEGEIGKSWRTFCSAGRFLSPVIDRAHQNNPKLRRLKADFEADDLKLWQRLPYCTGTAESVR
jgi:hypothetical protein